MTTIAKHATIAALAAGALFATQSTFVAGTAEAHCAGSAGHNGSCSNQAHFVGTHCEDIHNFNDYETYDGWCVVPAPGCSGAACLTWPCATGECTDGQPHACNGPTGSFSDDAGPDVDCGACDWKDSNWCFDRRPEGASGGYCSQETGICTWY